jgi:hypothetical protein
MKECQTFNFQRLKEAIVISISGEKEKVADNEKEEADH